MHCHIHMHAYAYPCTDTCSCVPSHAYSCTCLQRMHALIHACTYACIHAFMKAQTHACMHACIHVCLYACILHSTLHPCVSGCIIYSRVCNRKAQTQTPTHTRTHTVKRVSTHGPNMLFCNVNSQRVIESKNACIRCERQYFCFGLGRLCWAVCGSGRLGRAVWTAHNWPKLGPASSYVLVCVHTYTCTPDHLDPYMLRSGKLLASEISLTLCFGGRINWAFSTQMTRASTCANVPTRFST